MKCVCGCSMIGHGLEQNQVDRLFSLFHIESQKPGTDSKDMLRRMTAVKFCAAHSRMPYATAPPLPNTMCGTDAMVMVVV